MPVATARLTALRASGRLIVMTETPSTCSTSTASLSAGAMRIAPSRRIVSPLSIGLATMALTSWPYSDGSPSRDGCGTCLPSEACTSSGRLPSSGVLNRPGAMVTTRIFDWARSRAIGSVMPTMPPLDAE